MFGAGISKKILKPADFPKETAGFLPREERKREMFSFLKKEKRSAREKKF
ncbi:MAG: hypothetical protein LBG87_05055 [Spirochaetaceae bacterium]|jgi:hypothetical protein|nr:hypothetical protein [Spirochaetaceae bacterium]